MIDFTLTENDQARLERTYAEGRWVRQFVRAADENEAELPPNMLPGVVQRLDVSVISRLRTINNVTGGKNSRCEDLARALHLRCGEYLRRIVRRIVNRRYTKSEGRIGRPVLLWNDSLTL